MYSLPGSWTMRVGTRTCARSDRASAAPMPPTTLDQTRRGTRVITSLIACPSPSPWPRPGDLGDSAALVDGVKTEEGLHDSGIDAAGKVFRAGVLGRGAQQEQP